MDPRAEEVTHFWLDEVGEDGWYARDDARDTDIRERWLPLWEEARTGGLRDWRCSPRATLALCVVLDQFPRNMFRGDPRAFASDPLARLYAKAAVLRGFDKRVPTPGRQFFYLPLSHSELLSDQDRAVRLTLMNFGRDSELLRHAIAHREIIRRFGRFPFRNAALGRPSRPEEVAFLDAGGYSAALEKIPA
jgi:uncharacterized protein (DUF924 family)